MDGPLDSLMGADRKADEDNTLVCSWGSAVHGFDGWGFDRLLTFY